MMDFHIITYPLNGLLMIGIPLGLGFMLDHQFRFGWRLWWIGAATFILSQIGHIPFNAGLTLLFQRGILPPFPESWKLVANATILGLSAGLWEEMARYAVLRWWAREDRSWRKAIFFGAGHGGIEAILLGTLVLVNFFYLFAVRNIDLATLVPPDQHAAAQAGVNAYWNAPWYATLLGAVERAFTLPFHLSASVLVMQAFLRRQKRWLAAAVGWHALVDAVAVLSAGILNAYITEAIIGGFALISLVIVFLLRSPEPAVADEPVYSLPPTPGRAHPLPPPEETADNLENTRYT